MLEEAYLRQRRSGILAKDVLADLGFRSSLVQVWETRVSNGNDRHHLRVDVEDEATFWRLFDCGVSTTEARTAAGVSRSTVYRWIEKRFTQLRGQGLSSRQCALRLRLTAMQYESLEARRVTALRSVANAESAAQRQARSEAGRHADQVISSGRSLALKRRDERRHDYWELMRKGVSNIDACRLLGMSRSRRYPYPARGELSNTDSGNNHADGGEVSGAQGTLANRAPAGLGQLVADDRQGVRAPPVDNQPRTSPSSCGLRRVSAADSES